MNDREWMYMGHPSAGSFTNEWISKTNAFLEEAFQKVKGARGTWCPCSRSVNKKRQTKVDMGKHLCKYGFTEDYTRWIYHGEVDHMRDEVVRQRVNDFDAKGGVADMLHDYHEAHFGDGRREEEEKPEATAKAYYDMLSVAQKPLHGQTKVSQLNAIGRVMTFKSQFSLGQEAFDTMLTILAACFRKVTFCQRACTSRGNSFVHLRCYTSRYMLVKMGAFYLGNNTRKQRNVQSVNPLGTWR
jgi:hypothetical protein